MVEHLFSLGSEYISPLERVKRSFSVPMNRATRP